jgi:ATP-dependent Clp protease ATP-binding subunit ClpA
MKPKAVRVFADKLSDEAQVLQADLLTKIVGQDRAVNQLVKAFEIWNARLNKKNRPLACLLFLGPSGVGKTRLAEALAEALFGSNIGITKVDCGEYMEDHRVSQLIGSPAGYVGHDRTPPRLSQEKLDEHLRNLNLPRISILLFDEIEKGSPDLHKLLLGMMDKGSLALGNGKDTDLTHTIIILTSNLGSQGIATLLSHSQMGFHDTSEHEFDDIDQKIYKSSMQAVRKAFTPEFVARLDRTVVFRPLSRESLRIILKIEIMGVQDRLLSAEKFTWLDVSERAREFLLDEGIDNREGARNLCKSIERYLTSKLASLVATKQIGNGDKLLVDKEPEEFELSFHVLKGIMDIPESKLFTRSPKPLEPFHPEFGGGF